MAEFVVLESFRRVGLDGTLIEHQAGDILEDTVYDVVKLRELGVAVTPYDDALMGTIRRSFLAQKSADPTVSFTTMLVGADRFGVKSVNGQTGDVILGTGIGERYTPAVTPLQNLDQADLIAAMYTRVGDVVTVSAEIDVDPTVLAIARFAVDLPINTGVSAVLAGLGVVASGANILVTLDQPNNAVECAYTSLALPPSIARIFFQYTIV